MQGNDGGHSFDFVLDVELVRFIAIDAGQCVSPRDVLKFLFEESSSGFAGGAPPTLFPSYSVKN